MYNDKRDPDKDGDYHAGAKGKKQAMGPQAGSAKTTPQDKGGVHADGWGYGDMARVDSIPQPGTTHEEPAGIKQNPQDHNYDHMKHSGYKAHDGHPAGTSQPTHEQPGAGKGRNPGKAPRVTD